MTMFYTAADTEINHDDGTPCTNIIKEFIETLNQMMQKSIMIISLTKDFFRHDSIEQCSEVDSITILSQFHSHDEILPPISVPDSG